MSELGLAPRQIDTMRGLCNFLESAPVQALRDSAYPASMPADLGSGGFDTPVWLGLGIVGIWAALDAYAERAALPKSTCVRCGRKCSRALQPGP